MLFMCIFTWEPDRTMDVIKQRAESGPMIPEGVKFLGQWAAAAGPRVFTLIDVDNVAQLTQVSFPWEVFGKMEAVAVIETEEGLTAIGQ